MTCNHNYIFTKNHYECTKCGHIRKGKSQSDNKKKIGITIGLFALVGIIGYLFANDILEINRENWNETLEKLPREFQDIGITAKEVATNTSIIVRANIEPAIDDFALSPVKRMTDDISQIPKYVKENNPINEKPKINKTDLEIQVHHMTNQYRQEHGLELLNWDDDLAEVARGHSKGMASRNYFDHITPEGLDPTDRAKNHGYECEKIIGNLIYKGIAENIFQNNLYDTVWYVAGVPTLYEWNTQQELAQSTVDGWMNSTGHRENILTNTFDREGIGIEITEDDKVYVTQNFC